MTVQSREGTSYWTRLICAPGTPVTLEDSLGATLESDTCETGLGTEGDGEELTFRATTPDGKPIRLVVVEATDMESPSP
ncbi:hypothetical protein [Micrococcus sp. FDAARGOS_333]|uniref:hypothetical protein n=1 Tax=Micrococcus sp. FDAARGOS_333 TaxID=1930558 RepID=UPI000B4E687D|nr:hypothetical protein [Micrococcus sp. FDAARGOS_333]PNL16821.1 hypothetical protein CEQ11_000345 [Micrococcus sp. FDAARGOS_333]